MLLSLPTFGLALAISVLTTYGPVILIHLVHSPAAVGALIGAEGALALVSRLPPVRSLIGCRPRRTVVGCPL